MPETKVFEAFSMFHCWESLIFGGQKKKIKNIYKYFRHVISYHWNDVLKYFHSSRDNWDYWVKRDRNTPKVCCFFFKSGCPCKFILKGKGRKAEMLQTCECLPFTAIPFWYLFFLFSHSFFKDCLTLSVLASTTASNLMNQNYYLIFHS